MINVTKKPVQISAPKFSRLEAGMSLSQIVKHEVAGYPGKIFVELNGNPVAQNCWDIVPKDSDHVLIYTLLQGGGNNILRMILSLAVMVAATTYGGPLGLAMGLKGGLAVGIGTAAIGTAGMLLVNAIAPIRQPKFTAKEAYEASRTYSFSGSRNTENPYGPIPILLGRMKVYPYLGTKPYTEIIGNDEFLRVCVVWGYGPLSIGTIKIGDTPITAYDVPGSETIKIETREGWEDDPPTELFPAQVSQTAVGVPLKQASGWIVRTATAGGHELSVDTYFQNGLVRLDNQANRLLATVELETQYREVGTVDWATLAGVKTYAATTLNILNDGVSWYPSNMDRYRWYKFGVGTNSIYFDVGGDHADLDAGRVTTAPGTATRDNSIRIGTFVIAVTMMRNPPDSEGRLGSAYPVYRITSAASVTSTAHTGLQCSLLNDNQLSVAAGTGTFTTMTYNGRSPSTQRFTQRWHVDPERQYEVRRQRVTADTDDDDKIIDEATWTTLRSVRNEAIINTEHPLSHTIIRVKANENLNNAVDTINAECVSYASIYSSGWVDGPQETSNPAALFRHVLLGNGSAKPRKMAQVNDVELGEWYEFCELHGYQFNMYRDFRSSVWDLLVDIASAGRAAVSMTDGIWSVIIDGRDRPITGHITPRNSWGFSSEKQLIEMPHAFRVRFRNAAADYEWDEVPVYDDGYSQSTATLFETIELPWCTSSDLAWKFGRYHIAQARLRPEQYSVYQDFEHLSTPRGSKVMVAHDVPLWGLYQGRVRQLVLESAADIFTGGTLLDELDDPLLDELGSPLYDETQKTVALVLDTKIAMISGSTYSIRVRRPDESLVYGIETVVGETFLVKLSTQVPMVSGPQVGDLFQFGETDRESTALLVKSIERSTEYVAKLILVDEAPAIYNADTGAIPPFNTNITTPIDVTRIPPGIPVITNVRSGTVALEVVGDTIRARILVSIMPAGGTVKVRQYRLRYQEYSELGWRRVSVDADTSFETYLTDVVEGDTYRIQAQAIGIYGMESDWSPVVIETVVGESELPGDVTGFRVNVVGSYAHLSWNRLTDVDLSHYKIRWSPSKVGATWAASVAVVERVGKDSTSVSVAAMVGTYLIKGVDRQGNESENATLVITNITRIQGLNFVELFEQEHPTWSGTASNTEVDTGLGGIVVIDLELQGSYEFDTYVDLGAVFTCRLTAALYISGQDLYDDLYDRGDLYSVDNLYGTQEGQYNAEVQVSLTDDDPDGTPAWGIWNTFLVGDYTARGFRFRVILTGTPPSITPILEKIEVEVDMPDRIVEFHESVTVDGATITFDPAFYVVPEIGLSVFDGAEGDKYTISSLTVSGFTIAFTNGAVAVAREVSGIAKAYGELVT